MYNVSNKLWTDEDFDYYFDRIRARPNVYKRQIQVDIWAGGVNRKSASGHAQPAQIQINQRLRKVSSGPLLSIHTFIQTIFNDYDSG